MLLSPVGWLYGRIADIRNMLYEKGVLKSHMLGAKTISIGNITTGGTGKTPLVIYVAEILADAGEKVCILTRGYGRSNPRDRVLVSDGTNVLVDARTGGDEPVELARKLMGKAIIVADVDRVAAAAWAKEKFGITAFVLDDGFQHRRAKRDLDIVCVDATNPWGGSRMLPAGSLREPLKNLARSDAIVVTRSDIVLIGIERFREALSQLVEFVPATRAELDQWYAQAERLRSDFLTGLGPSPYMPHFLWHYLADADIRMKDKTYAQMQNGRMNTLLKEWEHPLDEIKNEVRARSNISGAAVFTCWTEIDGLLSLSEFENNDEPESWTVSGAEDGDRQGVLAFCALGNPDAFFAQVSLDRKVRTDLSFTHAFPDHHRYIQPDIDMLEEKARRAGVKVLLTTAKDAVKLSGLKFTLPCYVVEVEVAISDAEAFRDLVLSA
jgi:tetraacyldisaccharide 4'-kinase